MNALLCGNYPGDMITAHLHDGTIVTGEYLAGNVLKVTLLGADGTAFDLAEADVDFRQAQSGLLPTSTPIRNAAIDAFLLADMETRRAARTAEAQTDGDPLDVTHPGAPAAPTENAGRTTAVQVHLRAHGVTNTTVSSGYGWIVVTLGSGPGASMDDAVAVLAELPWAEFTIAVNHYQHTITVTPAEPAAIAAAPLVIVPCGGQKLDRPAPAGEMYTGSYHQLARRAAEAIAAPGARIMILSAKHGLLDLDTVIDPYEQHMTDPGAITREQLADQARALGIDQAHNVTVLAGRAYADAVTHVWPHASRLLDGCKGMGYQRQRMSAMTAMTAASVDLVTTTSRV